MQLVKSLWECDSQAFLYEALKSLNLLLEGNRRMKESKINKALAKPLLVQTLKGPFFKVGLVAVVLIALIGTQQGQTREDSVQRIKNNDNLFVGNIKASNSCPVGEVLGAYDKPIYNEEGTLIIDWEKAWMCFPEAFEPASS